MPEAEVFEVEVQTAEKKQQLQVMKDGSLAPVPTTKGEVMRILELALEKGVSGEELSKIVALGERMADRKALTDFSEAMAAFQSECPPIPESKRVDVTKDGRKLYQYTYAPLEKIMKIIRPYLSKHGFTSRWDSDLSDGKVTALCHIRHISGHQETSKFTATIEAEARMTDVQAASAALTTARRQALIQVLGLEPDPDTDAAPPEARISPDMTTEPPLTEDMLIDLENRCKELGRTKEQLGPYLRDVHRIGNGKVQDLRKGQYDDVVRVLQDQLAKRRAK